MYKFCNVQLDGLIIGFFILTEAALALVADSDVFYNQQLT
jgi:hypothetical protein